MTLPRHSGYISDAASCRVKEGYIKMTKRFDIKFLNESPFNFSGLKKR